MLKRSSTAFGFPTRRAGIVALIALVAAGSSDTVAAAPAADQEVVEVETRPAEPQEASEEEIIEEILLLERRLEELRGLLSPAAREELARRLEELRALELAPAVRTQAGDPTSPGEPQTGAVPERAPGPAPTEASKAPVETGQGVAPLPEPIEEAPEIEDTAPRCAPLRPFDSTGDGALTALDRAWRFFAIWIDHDGDGRPQERELEHPFALGIEEISLDLRTFRTRDDFTGDVRREDRIYLQPLGRGANTGILMLDATRLRSGGGPTLLGPEGEELEGLQPLGPDLLLRGEDGSVTSFDCS